MWKRGGNGENEADALAEADAVDDEDDDGQDACPRKSGLDDDEAEGTSTRTSKRSSYAARVMVTTRMPQQPEEEGSAAMTDVAHLLGKEVQDVQTLLDAEVNKSIDVQQVKGAARGERPAELNQVEVVGGAEKVKRTFEVVVFRTWGLRARAANFEMRYPCDMDVSIRLIERGYCYDCFKEELDAGTVACWHFTSSRVDNYPTECATLPKEQACTLAQILVTSLDKKRFDRYWDTVDVQNKGAVTFDDFLELLDFEDMPEDVLAKSGSELLRTEKEPSNKNTQPCTLPIVSIVVPFWGYLLGS
ncbi:hypothetical protein AK812_SmicGene24250 [Symbiodinium microadriaticum]|uniref:EF-hand domain-containing protein n=1 Tax=Symbiodinium microadriaticum TaxID=2951 RepID=A0A1Q9DF34_SYMMI|nr:hypothetical protein AK812_SmicGene24250 [Symbiodinium microadriaticum]